MKRSAHYLLATLALFAALSASPAQAGGKGKFNLSSGGMNQSRSLSSNAMKLNVSPKPLISSNAARFTSKSKLQVGNNLSSNVGTFSQHNVGNLLNTPVKIAPRANRLPNGFNTKNLGTVIQAGNTGVGTPLSPAFGKFKDRVKLQGNGTISDAVKDGVLKRKPIINAGDLGVFEPGKGPIFDPGKGPIFDPPIGPIGDPGNGKPPLDPHIPPIGPLDPHIPPIGPLDPNIPPIGPLDPNIPPIDPGNGNGNPPADPGNPPADPGNPPADPDCPGHCPPNNNCGGGWGFPIPFPTWCGGYYGGYNGGYCGTTTVVQPVYTQVTPAAVVQPTVQAIDLELVEVRQLDRGDLASGQRPAFRVTVRNKTGEVVPVPFTVALAASIGRVPAADSAFAASRVNGLQAGQSLAVDVRLPATAFKLGVNADGQPVAYTWLTAVVDSHMEVEQADRQNDLATMNRSEVVMVALQQ